MSSNMATALREAQGDVAAYVRAFYWSRNSKTRSARQSKLDEAQAIMARIPPEDQAKAQQLADLATRRVRR